MRRLVPLLLALAACRPLPFPVAGPEGAEPSLGELVALERCLSWRAEQRGWAVTGAIAASLAGAGGVAGIALPRDAEAAAIGVGLTIAVASALSAGAGVAVTSISAVYAEADCPRGGRP